MPRDRFPKLLIRPTGMKTQDNPWRGY